MFRRVIVSCVLTSAAACSWASADPPGDLLDQAIKEKKAVADANGDARAAEDLVNQADRLAIQKKFDDAIALYEKAYRLNPADTSGYTKMLIVKRAAGRLSETEREALQLLEGQRKLKVEEIIRLARLDIVQAREALSRGEAALAQTKAEHGRSTLARLPKDVDVKIYRTELDKLASTAQRRGAKKPADAQPAHLSDTGQPASQETPAGEGPSEAIGRAMSQERYEPSGRIMEAEEMPPESDPFNRYQHDLDFAIKSSRANAFFGIEAAKNLEVGDMTFPSDWAEKTARRARYRDGVIYRSPTFTGEDGKEYHTAIYDLGDLVHPVPNFSSPYTGYARLDHQLLLDRQALRDRSMIFGGWPEDLAAGIPLLQYFGGMDNWAVSPRSDPNQLEQVLRTVDEFLKNAK